MSSFLHEISAATLIAEGTRVRGDLTFQSGTQVFGVVEGDVTQQSLESLQIGKSGWINGTIQSQGPVLIEGRVDGQIQSATKIKLMPTASVRGALTAPAVEIKPGAVFEGELKMKTQKTRPQPAKKAA
jgi:cytoskeletal protein CcmA (bactofilin family)